jgi:hypothetical protein
MVRQAATEDIVPVFAGGHLDVGRGAAAGRAVRAQPALEVFGQRLVDDAGGRLPQCLRQVLERLAKLARNLDGSRIRRRAPAPWAFLAYGVVSLISILRLRR